MAAIGTALHGVMAAVWAALYYCTWLFLGDCRVKLVAAAASDKKRNCVRALVEAHCPSLADPKKARYVPTPYLIGGMLQTVYCAYIALRRDKKSNIKYERELRTMRDGGTVSLDWYPGRIDDAKSTQPIVIVLSGLGGSSYEYHIRCLAKRLAATTDRGMRVVVANHRGCGRTPLTSSQLYNGHDTSDLTEVIAHVSKMFPCAPLACIGFSLGSNLVMRYLGEAGDHTPLAAAVGVCCPFDTVTTGHMMNKPGFLNDNLFQPALMRTLKRTVSRNLDMIRSGNVDYDIDAIMRAKRMSEIDNAITAKAYGFKDCWEYYAAVSPIDSVDGIRRPFLAINTHDDPITPVAGVPLDKFESNPHTAAAIVDYGGHLGFFTGIPARIWFLDPVAEFLAAALAESGDSPPC